MSNAREVIVGGGHAAAQLCASLADLHFEGSVTLVSEEVELPYHRPPLSKSFIKDAAAGPQHLRSESAYQEARVALHLGDPVTAIDRNAQRVALRSGATLAYDVLVLATGARSRPLPMLADRALSLRHAADARRIREELGRARSLTVIGGGYIGLELAASARQLGKEVRVLEAASRLLARSASPEVSTWLADWHRAEGIDIRLGVSPDELKTALADGVGAHTPDHCIIAGVGAVPETSLAHAASLACDNGVLVDAHLRSVSDTSIYAIGDCANFPGPNGERRRLESVQNANDQARCVAAAIAGNEESAKPYRTVPWFWSEQGSVRLQIAGLATSQAERHVRPGRSAREFSVLHYAHARLVAIESINSPLDHMAARKLLELGVSPPAAEAVQTARPLKQFLAP